MHNHRCFVCGVQPGATQWKNAFALSRHNHMLSNVPQEAKCGLRMHQHSLGACPLVHWSTLTGANTLSHKWSLGQSKCQLCALRPMSQCWRRTQGRRVASQTTSSIQMTSSGGFQQFFKFCLSSVSTLWVFCYKTRAPGYSLSIKFKVYNWHSPVGQRERESTLRLAECLPVQFGSPGVTGQIAEVRLICWTTRSVQIISQQKNKGHPCSERNSWTLKVSPFMTF